MNQAGRWSGLPAGTLTRRGVHTSVPALHNDINAWIATRNDHPRPFTRTKTADEILDSLAGYLAKAGTGHRKGKQNSLAELPARHTRSTHANLASPSPGKNPAQSAGG